MSELKTIGFALTGSFCTFSAIMPQVKALVDFGYNVIPIMSETAYSTDTRFGDAKGFVSQLEEITGNKVIASIKGAEPIGPKQLLDALIVAPCTGNTISKLANAISDSSVTLAAKAHLRNEKPVIIAISSNDSLANNAKNIGVLLNSKHIFFVPFTQDDPIQKHSSIVANMGLIPAALEQALLGNQLQPILS